MAEDRTVYKFEGDASGLIRAVNKASGAMEGAKKEAKKLDNELENVEHQAEKTAAGEIVLAGASVTAAGGMSALAAAASVAAIAIASVAAVFAVVVVALAAVAAGFVLAAVGIHKMITGANELYSELEPLYELGALEPIPPDQLKAIKEYTKNWEALKIVFQDLIIAVAGNLAKDLESVSFEILVIGIHLSDLVKSWMEGTSLIRKLIVDQLMAPIQNVSRALKGLLILWLPLIKAAEMLGIASSGTFKDLNKAIDDTELKIKGLAEEFVDNGTEYISEGLQKMLPDMAEARKKAEELREGMKKAGEASEQAGEDMAGAFDIDFSKSGTGAAGGIIIEEDVELAGALGDAMGRMAENMSDLTDPTGMFRDLLGEVSGTLDVIAETDFSTIEGNLTAVGAVAKSIGNLMDSIIQQTIRNNEELTDKQKNNLKILFGIQKAAALASIVVDTAVASVRAYKELGPIAGAIAAGVIAAVGVAQAAVVASEQPPFHTGGIIPGTPNDGVMINALPGESVLTREATAGLGSEGVAALNSGAGMAGGVTIEMVYKHRIFDNFVQDNISKGGPLRNAIKSGRRVGHRSRG